MGKQRWKKPREPATVLGPAAPAPGEPAPGVPAPGYPVGYTAPVPEAPADAPARTGAIPLMTAEEAAALTVPLAELARLPQVLEEHGCAIVPGVVTGDLEALFAEDLKAVGLPPPRSVPLAALDALGARDRCRDKALPHLRFAWACRLLPEVRRVYAALYPGEELVTSVDNAFFAPPAHPEARENRAWPHTDQNKHDPYCGDWPVYQGVVYVWPADAAHASTTVVWPGSHRAPYEELMAEKSMRPRGRKGNHFCMVHDHELKRRWLAGARRVPVPGGALLLWSSRTLHQGWSGGPRLALPVCWEPTWRRSAAARERKLRLAACGLPSTHWASLGLPHTLLGERPAAPRGARPLPLAPDWAADAAFRRFGLPPWDRPLSPEDQAALETAVRPEYRAVL